MSKTVRACGFCAALLTLAASLGGCSKELGRVPFATAATRVTTVRLSPGAVQFWTDLELSYLGTPAIVYRIDLEQAGRAVASAVCDPMGPKPVELGWHEFDNRDYHFAQGRAQMACSAIVSKGGPTVVRVTLDYAAAAKAITVTRADLVVKQ